MSKKTAANALSECFFADSNRKDDGSHFYALSGTY